MILPDNNGVPVYLCVPASVAERMNHETGRFWTVAFDIGAGAPKLPPAERRCSKRDQSGW